VHSELSAHIIHVLYLNFFNTDTISVFFINLLNLPFYPKDGTKCSILRHAMLNTQRMGMVQKCHTGQQAMGKHKMLRTKQRADVPMAVRMFSRWGLR